MTSSSSRAAHRRTPVDPLTALFAGLALGLILLFFLLLGSTRPEARGERIPYSTLGRLAGEGRIERAELLDVDHRALVTTRDGRDLWAAYSSSGGQGDALAARLSARGAAVFFDNQSGKQAKRLIVQVLLPILILASLFALFMRLGQRADAGGLGGFSRWRGRRADAGDAARTTTFADVAGAPTAVAELRELCDLLAAPDRYAALGVRAPKGVLVVGPPGTGKTLLARAMAGEAGAAFFAVSGAEFVESLVGVGAARIRDLRAGAPSRPRSCSSTSSTRSGASAAPGSARATTSASRRSTSCSSSSTASSRAAD